MAQMKVTEAINRLIEIMQKYEPRKAIISQLEKQGIRVDEVADYNHESTSLGIKSVLSRGNRKMEIHSAIYQDLSPQKEMEGHYAFMQDALFKNIDQLLS
jgi:hypothetical protein